jgi:hypothetical protein
MVTALEYRHVPTGTLAVLAQRLGTVSAHPSTSSCAKTPAACGSPGNWPIEADGGRLRLRNLSAA